MAVYCCGDADISKDENPLDVFKSNNPYWSNITDMYLKQRRKGIETYGQTLENNIELNSEDRIIMVQEELIDALMYLEHIKTLLKGK